MWYYTNGMNKPTLYLMMGYPGAGKTTTARIIHELTGAVHLWADKIRNERFPHPTHSHEENLALYQHLNELVAELLATGQDVVFDTNFNFFKDRVHLRDIATQHNAQTRLIWVKTPKRLARERATHPAHAERNTYPYKMPLERFDRISREFEPPRENEPCVTIEGNRIDRPYIQEKLGL